MKNFKYIFLLSLAFLNTACYESFLDIKSDKQKVIPTTIADFQALVDNVTNMNYASSHYLAILSTDDYVLTDQQWSILSSATERNAYIWKADIYEGEQSIDWNNGYKRILYANTTIEGLGKISPKAPEQHHWNNAMGAALFHRGLAFYELCQLFGDRYDSKDSQQKPGISIRLESDINESTPRASLESSYNQIISDISQAVDLLPLKQVNKEKPNKLAALALLSRIYLSMKKYEEAARFAEKCISSSETLMDYNKVDSNLAYSFSTRGQHNPEVFFLSRPPYTQGISNAIFYINPLVYEMYGANDLRKKLFFNQVANDQVSFKGSYFGDAPFFTGLALDEAYLIASESLLRLGKTEQATLLLQEFMRSRYKEFILPSGSKELLSRVLQERRKQLFGRGLYWSDLKRLNAEVEFRTTLSRVFKGEVIELSPLDKRFVFPLPDNAVNLGGLEQNERE